MAKMSLDVPESSVNLPDSFRNTFGFVVHNVVSNLIYHLSAQQRKKIEPEQTFKRTAVLRVVAGAKIQSKSCM